MVLQVKSNQLLGILGIPQILQEPLKSGSLGILLGKFRLFEVIICNTFCFVWKLLFKLYPETFHKLNLLITQMVNTNSKLNNLAGRR